MRKTLVMMALAASAACGKDTHHAGHGGGTSTDPTTAADPNTYTGPTIATQGRYVDNADKSQTFAWAGSKITTRVQGATAVSIKLQPSNSAEKLGCFVNVSIDGGTPTSQPISRDTTVKSYTVNLPDTNYHQITWTKITEASYCRLVFSGIDLPNGGTLEATSTPPNRHIEFIGDSITNGYGALGSMNVNDSTTFCNGNANNTSSDLSYAKLVADKLYADYTLIAYSGKGLVVNQDGTSSATHDASNAQNVNDSMPVMFKDAIPPVSLTEPTPTAWDTSKYTPDVVVINLGTNDFTAAHNTTGCTTSDANSTARQTACNPTSDNFVTPYVTFLKTVRETYPQAYIMLLNSVMLSDNYPKNGKQFATQDTYLKTVINTFGDGKTIYHAFAGPQDTSQPVGCDSHPSPSTHASMAAEVAAAIKAQAGWN